MQNTLMLEKDGMSIVYTNQLFPFTYLIDSIFDMQKYYYSYNWCHSENVSYIVADKDLLGDKNSPLNRHKNKFTNYNKSTVHDCIDCLTEIFPELENEYIADFDCLMDDPLKNIVNEISVICSIIHGYQIEISFNNKNASQECFKKILLSLFNYLLRDTSIIFVPDKHMNILLTKNYDFSYQSDLGEKAIFTIGRNSYEVFDQESLDSFIKSIDTYEDGKS
jgi:hypothetical protein